MREFFTPWRRKAGCVTLVMVCVMVAGWVRSHIICDVASVELCRSARRSLVYQGMSVHGGIGMSRNWSYWRGDSFPRSYPFGPRLLSAKAEDIEWWPEAPQGTDWFWHGCGFYAGGVLFVHSTNLTVTIIVSYSCIVAPLMLFSAWVFLSKPRPRSEPTKNRLRENRMREFSKGWRRKTGVLTVVIFLGGCVWTGRSSNTKTSNSAADELRQVASKSLRVGLPAEDVNAALIDQAGLSLLFVDHSGGASRLRYGRGKRDDFKMPVLLVVMRRSGLVEWKVEAPPDESREDPAPKSAMGH